eukprot:8150025-Alexandrium_andersonii.AAC.1
MWAAGVKRSTPSSNAPRIASPKALWARNGPWQAMPAGAACLGTPARSNTSSGGNGGGAPSGI